jgi:hypothetical protein
MNFPLRRIAGLVPGLLAIGVAVAAAAPAIPGSALPGQERQRFTTSPVERFMGPGPYVQSPVVTPYSDSCPSPHRSKHGSKRSKHC